MAESAATLTPKPLAQASGVSLALCSAGYSLRHDKYLVKPLSLLVAAGEHLAIVGPNGAGKSTLLKLMAGILQPSTGQVVLGDQPLAELSLPERARCIAVLAQNDQTDGRLCVQDYVGLGCLPHRRHWSDQQVKQSIEQALLFCDLHSLRQHALSTLSGGERQRTHLARALAQAPRILLLDEPTNHLDPRATQELLQGVAALGITVVAVLHDLARVPPWAHRVAVMQQGQLLAVDTPAQALSPQRLQQVFGIQAFYLPHPVNQQPMLVMDPLPRAAQGNASAPFFTS